MVSKTSMLAMVRCHRSAEIDAALRERPELIAMLDERGRNWLHICCGVAIDEPHRSAADSVRTAEVLVGHGLDINAEAFREGDWKATPLWFAIGRGGNRDLAKWLLDRGSSPNYCLWAAVFNGDFEAMRLLVARGADVDDRSAGETPFLAAVGWSRFAAAEELLKLGADPNALTPKGATALHAMLKKGSDKDHFAMVIRHGARGDIPDAAGVTANEIMARKRDPDFRRWARTLHAAPPA